MPHSKNSASSALYSGWVDLKPAGADYSPHPCARLQSSTTYLDTADGRVRRAGLLLKYEADPAPGAQVVTGPDGATTGLAAPPVWPALCEQLEPGPVRDRVASAMWIRAVTPVVDTVTVSRVVTVRNKDDKVVIRMQWQETTLAGRPGENPVVRVVLNPLLGYSDDAKRIARV